MYIMITDRCNMNCEHCCSNCDSIGTDMTIDTYREALQHCEGGYIYIGGGEPTMHPKFMEFLMLAICTASEGIGMTTNGSMSSIMYGLATLQEKAILDLRLSLTPYHDSINQDVIDVCTKAGCSINKSDAALPAGRAKTNDISNRDGCVCADVVIRPNGDMYLCGCDNAPKIGDVFEGMDMDFMEFLWDHDIQECINDYEGDVDELLSMRKSSNAA